MTRHKNYLQRNKKYFFCILYGIDIDTIYKLDFHLLGLRVIKIFSQEFERLSKQINGFPEILEEEFYFFKQYHAEDISLLFISENEDNIYAFYDILTLLRPSKIGRWLTFDTYYVQYKDVEKN